MKSNSERDEELYNELLDGMLKGTQKTNQTMENLNRSLVECKNVDVLELQICLN